MTNAILSESFNSKERFKRNESILLLNNDEFTINDKIYKLNDNIWDFRHLRIIGKCEANYRFDFRKIINSQMRDLCKTMLLQNFFISSIHSSMPKFLFCEFVKVASYLDISGMEIEHIDIKFVRNYLDHHNLEAKKYRTQLARKRYLLECIIFLLGSISKECPNDIFFFLKKIDQSRYKAEAEIGKTKLLPSAYVSILNEILYNRLMRNNFKYNDLMQYSQLFLIVNTGLRPSEVIGLLYDCIESRVIDDKTVYLLHYRSTKSQKEGYIFGQIKASQRIFDVIKLVQENRTVTDIYLYDIFNKSSNILNLLDKLNKSESRLNSYLQNSSSSHFERETTLSTRKSKVVIDGHTVIRKVVIPLPSLKQFRVYFASEMRARGVSDYVVAKMLNHKDEKMIGYYARSSHPVQEDVSFSSQIVKYVLKDDYNILGSRGEIMKDTLIEIAKESNLNTFKNIDEIIEKVLTTIPIRQKYGGFCIKSYVNRACEFDSITDEFYCAYNMCANQCTFFFHLDYYFDRYKDSLKIIERAVENNQHRLVEKEENKSYRLALKYLIPLFNELKLEIEKKGKFKIVSQHSNLEDIINDLESKLEEVSTWINQYSLKNLKK